MKPGLIPWCSFALSCLALLQSGPANALSPEDALWGKTIVSPRPLNEPDQVYMKSVEITLPSSGTGLPVTFHVYCPTDGAGLKFDVAAKTSAGVVDTAHTFTGVHVTPIGKNADGTYGQGSGRVLGDGAGQVNYFTPFNGAGWYRIRFTYGAPNANRTLSFAALDYSGNPLKVAWADPPGEANLSIRAKFAVDQANYVFFKGGAYRNTLPSMNAYADSIKVDGKLLYRRSFDQEQFNYPIGYLAVGEHTVEATFARTGDIRGKYWFGINEKSFDPLGIRHSWNTVQFVYDGEMRTGTYDAWNEGVAFAQGSQLVAGVRPPPVRRGNIFTVSLESTALNGQSQNATIRIYPQNSGTPMAWTATRITQSDYAGGYFSRTGYSTRYRELWRISVPADAPVGRYLFRALAPNGTQVGSDVLFYVVHNPLALLNTHPVSPMEIATFAYDDDVDGMNMDLDEGVDSDRDEFRDHFLAHMGPSQTPGQFGQRTLVSGAFRRTGVPTDFSMLDYAVAAASGTTNAFQTMRRLYRITSQRMSYGGSEQDEVPRSFIGASTVFPPGEAFTYAQPGIELPATMKTSGMCYSSAAVLASLARSMGLLSRLAHSYAQLGWFGDHGFTEVFIPDLPTHGGRTTANDRGGASDTDHWYVFDATSPEGSTNLPRIWRIYSESLGTRAQYGRTAMLMDGPESLPFNVLTNALTWDPRLSQFELATEALDVSAAYQSGPNFWMTSSGITGWLGRGEKDVYQISRSLTGANAVRVSAIANDGAYLVPKICVVPTSVSPAIPEACANAAQRQVLPSGDAYIVVFNDAVDSLSRMGDTIQYRLDWEY